MQKSTGIHCKVICNDQIRRFQFFDTEFSSLKDQVKKLLGLNNEFVLKYKDNEGDMITISSTEELTCAIDVSQKIDGGLIRLSVFSVEPSPIITPTPAPPSFQEYGREYSCPRGRGRGRWGGGGGRWSREGNSGEIHCHRGEKRKAKLMFKKDMFKAYLSTLEGKELSPEDERRKQMYQSKVQRLESILSEWFEPPKTENPEKTDVTSPMAPVLVPLPSAEFGTLEKEFTPQRNVQQYRNFNKKERKCRRKEQKKEKKLRGSQKNFLSEEDRAELLSLKNQIKEMKPGVWSLQDQLKVKKSEISIAFETGQLVRITELKNEIGKLKQEKRAKKAQIEPLRQRVHQLQRK